MSKSLLDYLAALELRLVQLQRRLGAVVTFERRLAVMQARLEALEGNASITAPFRVVDEDGTTLLELDVCEGEVRLSLYAPGRDVIPSVVLTGDERGGALAAFDPRGDVMGTLTRPQAQTALRCAA